MAYADSKRRASPSSVGAALAINGLMIAGMIFAAPDIMSKLPPTVVTLINPTRDPVVVPDDPKPVRDASPVRSDTRPHIPPKASGDTQPKGDFVIPGGDAIDPGTGTGLIVDPVPTPQPPVHQPVFQAARLNPRFAGALQPEYPPGMIRAEREGVVTVKVLIGEDGRVKAVEAIRADDDAFLAATRKQALAKWRFLPATRDGTAVESWREMTVRFELPD